MSWRWLERGAQPALVTLLEGVWLGGLAGVLLDVRPWPLVLLAWALAGIGAGLTAARGGGGRPAEGRAESGDGDSAAGGSGDRTVLSGAPGRRERDGHVASDASGRREHLLRAAAVGVLAVATAALVMLQWPADARSVATLTLRDAVFVLLALWLGGRATGTTEPRAVTITAARCFALLVAVLVAARAAHQPLGGAVTLVCVALVAGVAVVALTRVADELGDRARGGRMPRSVLGLVVVMGLVVVLLAVASGPLQGPIDDLLGLIAAGLHRAADGVAFVVSWLAGAIMRLFSAVGDLLRGGPQDEPGMESSPGPPATPTPGSTPGGSSEWAQVFIWLLVAVCAAGGLLLLWRHTAWRRADEPAGAEEHESLAGRGALRRRAFSRLATMLARVERAVAPRTPAEALRREYRRLEAALAAAGHGRAPDVSARAHLASLPLPEDEGVGALPDVLASLYERARYSPFGCERQDVARFRELGDRLRAVVGAE